MAYLSDSTITSYDALYRRTKAAVSAKMPGRKGSESENKP